MLGGFLVIALMRLGDEPERKAVTFLAAEVPKWSREHHCFSCHNNGDAARALYRAKSLGLAVAPKALSDTTAWLERPENWDSNGPDSPFSDMRLARIEFATALLAAVESGRTEAVAPLERTAARLAGEQGDDGSWPIEDGGTVGSPATYGRPLATALTIRVLRRADAGRYQTRIAAAETWLRSGKVADVVTASALLMVEPTGIVPVERSAAGRRGLEYLRKAQSRDGAWGPHTDAPTEAFDTALALIALAAFRDDPGIEAMLARGRGALAAMQLEDGSWPETTRPPGGQSYAQRLSTAGWATNALFAARPRLASRGSTQARQDR
jgi:hypothetical protein